MHVRCELNVNIVQHARRVPSRVFLLVSFNGLDEPLQAGQRIRQVHIMRQNETIQYAIDLIDQRPQWMIVESCFPNRSHRSEERRVGKERSSRWSRDV